MSDEAAASAPEGEAPPGGIKAKLPLILAVVVGLAVGGGSGAMLVGPLVAKKMGFSASAVPAKAGEHGAAEGDSTTKEGEAGGEHGGKEGGAAEPPVLVLDNLVLNPANSGGSRYLLLTVAIESTDAKSVAALTARDAELKDLLLTTLSSKTVDQLSDISAREGIKAELTAAVKERFGKTSVKQLYFPQFVIQ